MTQSVIYTTDAPDEAEKDTLHFFMEIANNYGGQRAIDAFMTVITNMTVSSIGIPGTVNAFRRHADLLEKHQN